jgi:hypothetical protein
MTKSERIDGEKLDRIFDWYQKMLQLPELRADRDRIGAARARAPSELKSALGLLLHFLDDRIDAIRADDPEGMSAARDLLRKGPSWLRQRDRFTEIRSYIRVDENDLSQAVLIEWHRVPTDLREATVSLASLMVDASQGRHRRGGRPRKIGRKEPGPPNLGTAEA